MNDSGDLTSERMRRSVHNVQVGMIVGRFLLFPVEHEEELARDDPLRLLSRRADSRVILEALCRSLGVKVISMLSEFG